jgi:hypothetical protein
MTYVFVIVLGLLAAVGWLFTSVVRGARKRDEIILKRLDAIGRLLKSGGAVAAADVERVAHARETRPLLYEMLHRQERLDLFPPQYLAVAEQAKSKLAYWMMHPHELRAPPLEIEVLESVERSIQSRQAEFVVLRYRMPPGHWAGPDWLIGVVGPFFDGDRPYLNGATAFSRSTDCDGSVQPTSLVDAHAKRSEANLKSNRGP